MWDTKEDAYVVIPEPTVIITPAATPIAPGFGPGNIPNEVIDLTLVQGDITVTYSGTTGSGIVASYTDAATIGEGYALVTVAPSTGLSNGDTVTATITPEEDYTINGKASETFDYTVSGLQV